MTAPPGGSVSGGSVPGSEVTLTRVGDVAHVTLSRPRHHNALDAATKTLLREHLEAVAADREVRAVVLSGAGASFCVGQDLAEHAGSLARRVAAAFDTVDEDYAPIVRLLASMPKPVVAAVRGACVGAGLGLALACDVRVVADDARLATAFTAIGLTCDSGLSRSLPEAVGISRARELLLTGRAFTATQAEWWGVALEVTAPDRVEERAATLAAELAAGPTLALAETKALLAGAAPGDLGSVLDAESAAQHRLGATQDHADAVAAFLAKRRPVFHGR